MKNTTATLALLIGFICNTGCVSGYGYLSWQNVRVLNTPEGLTACKQLGSVKGYNSEELQRAAEVAGGDTIYWPPPTFKGDQIKPVVSNGDVTLYRYIPRHVELSPYAVAYKCK
jgi:hypothetical protein